MPNHLARSSTHPARRVWGWIIVTLTTCIVMVSIIFAQQNSTEVSRPIVAISSDPAPASAAPSPTQMPIKPTPPISTTQAVTDSTPPKAEPTRIRIPDARIDMSVLLLPQSSIVNGVLTPPETPDAYWVDKFDQPGIDSTDLTLIVSHACEGLPICDQMDWQFSRLSNRNLISQGAVITVETQKGAVCYAADSAPVVYEKDSLSNENEEAVFGTVPRPDKLVLISCYTADTSNKNVVVIATRKAC